MSANNLNVTQTSFFALGIASEVVQMYKFFKQNTKKLFYYSNILDQFGFLSEFVWQHLDEKIEPLIGTIEGLKFFLKFYEYCILVKHERIGCYIDKSNYDQLTVEKE